MKKLFIVLAIAVSATAAAYAQPTPSLSTHPKDAKPIASPRDSVVATLQNGTIITMTYGSPGVWGRTMGKDLDPMEDSVWRAGANEATTFAVDRDVMIEGQKLPAGRYAFFTIKHGNEWTLIFNKTWNTWGAYSYKQNMAQDALKVKVQQMDAPGYYNERLKYVIGPDGNVYMMWGPAVVMFKVS
ncbi:DUF2911 domain-containing protein [Ilyomonas limi]|jgi:hypothetical protein|nr:DUF2911 domain-containing protein [Ilyomonas limi]